MKGDRLLKAATEMFNIIRATSYNVMIPASSEIETMKDFENKREEWHRVLNESKEGINNKEKLREVKEDLMGECGYIKNLNLGKLTKEELINKIEGTRWHLEQITIAGIEKELKEE